MNIKKITIISLFIAMFYTFSIFLTINVFGNIKFTLQSLPLFVGSILLGSIPGMLIGGIGMFLNQVLSNYGLTPTTVFWILPYIVSGFVSGIVFNKFDINKNKFYFNFIIFIFLLIIITMLNTIAFFIDSKLFGYYNFNLVFGMLVYKILSNIILAFIYASVFPVIVKILINIV